MKTVTATFFIFGLFSATTAIGANKPETVQLICSVADDAGTNQRDISIALDINNKTANGWPASITDAEVQWRSGKDMQYSHILNRYTGAIIIYIEQYSIAFTGKCYRPSERQF